VTDLGSQPAAQSASRKPALHDAGALMRQMLWSVPETAFMCRVAARTVWRLMADPKSKFPEARRARGRTLLARDEVLRFFNLPGGAASN
jgi:hypothetical protein